MSDHWPDPADLCRGLSAALANDQPSAIDWAGELLVAIDRAIGDQVATILAAAPLTTLRAAWLGLARVLEAMPANESTPLIEVQACDASDWSGDDSVAWLHRQLYAGPLDTRGGRPMSMVATGLPIDDLATFNGFAAVAEQAICPIVARAAPSLPPHPYLTRAEGEIALRPPLSADPDWTAWFGWGTAATETALVGTAPYAIAVAAVRSVAQYGWPFALSGDASLPRLLMATRMGQIVAVRCREQEGKSPAEVAADIGDALRGQYVGPRLPLRWVEVAVETTGGRPVWTLRMSPRLGGDDPDDAPLTIRIQLGGK